MSGWSPPSLLRERIVVLAVLYVSILLYAVLIRGAFLVAFLPGAVLVAGYVVWRFLVALESIADGVHRIADERQDQ